MIGGLTSVRFRTSDYDIAMPAALVHYWRAWNEHNFEVIRSHLSQAVTHEVEWNDPRDSFTGIDALEDAVRKLRTRKPEYQFFIRSEIDAHHRRLRYRWNMTRNGRVLMEGTDVVTLDSLGKIERVDGFFGAPTPINGSDSGVPAEFRE